VLTSHPSVWHGLSTRLNNFLRKRYLTSAVSTVLSLYSVADQLGVTVTGVDLTKDGIDLAIQRAKAKSLPATFFQGFG
jgi:hypothetical protein